MTREGPVSGSENSPGEPPTREALSGRKVGEFVIREQLSEGGYGFIYRATQETLGREVVIKVLRWSGSKDDEKTQRFLREAKLASQLDHPYAAHVYSFGAEPDGLLWIAMELVRGTPLKELLETQGSIALARFVPLLEKICEVVYTAHQQGIVHRDLKPSNVMVLSRAGQLLPKLLDFGIARLVTETETSETDQTREIDDTGDTTSKPDLEITPGGDAVGENEGDIDAARSPIRIRVAELAHSLTDDSQDATLTRRGMSIGSPPYMAPEQWLTAAMSDARTDQYALAVLSFEAITGKRPFSAPNPQAMAVAHTSEPVPLLGPGFPPDLDMVMNRAMAKKARARFDSVLELAQAFRAASGLESDSNPLPRIEVALREAMLAQAPQPLADSVAMLESARTPARALDAANQVVRVAVRLLGLLAVAAVTRIGAGQGVHGDTAREALHQLRRRRLSTGEWLDLLRTLLRPFANKPDAHPIPELVILFGRPGESSTLELDAMDLRTGEHALVPDPTAHTAGEKPRPDDVPTSAHQLFDRLARIDPPEDEPARPDRGATGRDGEPRVRLARTLADLTRLLRRLSFLCHYPWIVRRGLRKEAWMGAQRSARPRALVKGAMANGDVAITTRDGVLLLTLNPLCQVLAPAPGAPDELFLFDGPSRFGAKLMSHPVGFERHDSSLWTWYRDQVVDFGDDDESDGLPASGQAPYMGLTAFSPSDADNYFGREREVQACVNRLRIDPLLAVVGPSGAGKSSFVQAGIIPAMPLDWLAITVRPGRDPLAQLAARLHKARIVTDQDLPDRETRTRELDIAPDGDRDGPQGNGDGDGDGDGDGRSNRHPGTDPGRGAEAVDSPMISRALRDSLRDDPESLGWILREHANESGQPVLLIVDQFEELLTLCLDHEERNAYAAALMSAAQSGDDPVRVIITLRDDFLIRIQQIPALRERLQQALQLVSTPAAPELERILVEPARRAGYRFEDSKLPREMVKAVADEPSALALLSFTASKLWDMRDRQLRQLSRRAYQTLGGVGGALAQHAEETLDTMRDEHRPVVREVFRQLVTADGTRAVLTHGELNEILESGASTHGGDQGDSDAVLEALISSRLLVASEGTSGEDRIEVVHEALLRSWPRLVQWQREDAESVRLRDQLRAAARQWVDRDRPDGLLWRDDALLEYRVWRGRYPGSLTEAEEGFARASLGADERGRQRRRVALGSAFAVLLLGLVVVLALARQANVERSRAESFASESAANAARAEANAARAEAHATRAQTRLLDLYQEQGRQALLSGEPGKALVYLLEALQGGSDSPALHFMIARSSDALDDVVHTLPAHEGTVWAVQFSPDGSKIATGGADHVAKIWDSTTGALLTTLQGHDKDVWTLRFNSDGTRLVTAGWDNTAKVWNAASGELLWSGGHDLRVYWADFTSDSTRLATISVDGTARIWRADTGDLLHTFSGHGAPVLAGALTPDSQHLLTGGNDFSTRTWNLTTGAQTSAITGYGAPILSVAISPDGSRAASASIDQLIRLFPTRGTKPLVLTGHRNMVTRVAFSPDGKRVISTSEDQTARVWDGATGETRLTLEGHGSGVTWARFTRDQQRILTTSRDGSARTWDAMKGTPLWSFVGHSDGIWTGALDPSSQRLATAGLDGTVWIWNARRTSHSLALPGDGEVVDHALFSPDGVRIATARQGGLVQIFNRQGFVERTIETGQARPRLAWSPDGSQLLVSGGATALFFDAASGEALGAIGDHGDGTRHALFSPDGSWIATAGRDKTAKLWDATTRSLHATLSGHKDTVQFIDFDPSGERLITASVDKTARLWNVRTGALEKTLSKHSQALNWVRFSRDGAFIITAGEDKPATIWTGQGEFVTLLEGHSVGIPSAAIDPGGTFAVTGGEDETVKLWDIATGQELWSIPLHGAWPRSVDFSPTGQLVVAAGDSVRIWDLASEKRDLDQLARFAACRVGYAVQSDRLRRAAIDHTSCQRAEQETRPSGR